MWVGDTSSFGWSVCRLPPPSPRREVSGANSEFPSGAQPRDLSLFHTSLSPPFVPPPTPCARDVEKHPVLKTDSAPVGVLVILREAVRRTSIGVYVVDRRSRLLGSAAPGESPSVLLHLSGLVKIAESLGQTLLPPRKKIVVLLIGNHSAGKSTFINWYIEEHVQKTGVAIETQGFALVTSGKKRESLTGNATLHLYPHFKPLQKIKGVVDYLTTEISTSRQKRFSLVTFIDTPGLVDGDMKYPYDVNKTILWLGQMADLIFVFFDPIGQALCKRTLNIVEELNDKFVDKMRFYLSKADEAGHEADRQKVMMQIVQELCKRPGLNRCGFDMPAIYIPDASKQAVRCVNQIEEVCKDIEKTINQTVQNALNSLEHDCEQLSSEVSLRISRDNNARSENLSTGGRGLCLGLFGLALPSLLLLNLALRNAPEEVLFSYLGPTVVEFLYLFMLPLQVLSGMLPDSIRLGVMLALFAISIFILLIAKWQSRLKPILTRQEKRTLLEAQSYLRDYVKPKKQRLYEEYLRQSVADYDL